MRSGGIHRNERCHMAGNLKGAYHKMNTAQKSICVMIGDVDVIHDFSSDLLRGIFDTADKEGVRLLYLLGMPRHAGPTEQDSKGSIAYRRNSIYDYAYLFGADAYIFSCGSLSGFENEDAFQEFLKNIETHPYVILQENVRGKTPGSSCITVDNYNSFCECIEHLIQVHGHRKIAFLAGIEDHPDTKERLLAYRNTMKKHGLPVTHSMIAYGDYSEFSDNQALQLINNNPGLEAIACCNDEMAKGCYRVCATLGLKVGKDIAITGFDNFSLSRSLMPPLTTVSQDIYQMGETAVKQAIALMSGIRVGPVKLKTELHIRRSCGCYPDAISDLFNTGDSGNDADINTVLKNISADLINAYSNSEHEQGEILVTKLINHIRTLLSSGPLQIVDRCKLADWLQEFVEEYAGSAYIIAKRLNEYMMQMPNESLRFPSMKNLYHILSFTQGFLFSFKASMTEKNLDEFRAQSWFIPEFIRDLVDSDLDDESVFLNVVKRLSSINLKNIYICLLPEPQSLRNNGSQNVPSKVLLAAYCSDTKIRAFSSSQMPLINADDTLRSLPDLKNTTHLMSFSIFSGDVLYGILMCEADISKCFLLHVIGLQLGILTNFMDLKRKERIVGNELENIRERNEILNFLYEYDPLCNILNRRGFIERAIRLNRDNIGKAAICVFMDLDHLKEINDDFGHSEGDTALLVVSDIFKKAVRSQDLVARVGGDEFVGMFIMDTPDFADVLRKRLRQAFEDYNNTSGLPYYIEASIGMVCFTCDHNLEIGKIVNEADQYLYEEKKHKRPSASRHQAS
jgi:diguanylate cyclase (GGDEF)-like protein